MIKPAKPADVSRPGYDAAPGGKTANAPARPHNPVKYWDDYYKKHDERPGQLLDTLILLREDKKFDDVEAALRGYLVHRTAHAEPWMYEMLAVAIERRKGPAEEVKTLLGYAAFQAIRSKNPNHLVSVADLLYRRGIFDKVGPPGRLTTAAELIDMAIVAIPLRAEPLMMSINVAAQTKDPKRMADAVDRLLSFGWPGVDPKVRAESRAQVNALAKALKEDGRTDEADALLARLPASMARDVYLRLSWEGVDDLDLVVEEPLGATAQLYKNPRTIFGGAIVANGYGNHPEEIYVCPRGFSGKYTVRVDKIFQPEKPATVAHLEIITHEGTPEEHRETRSIDLTKAEPVVVTLEGGRRKEVLPLPPPPVLIRPNTATSKAAAK